VWRRWGEYEGRALPFSCGLTGRLEATLALIAANLRSTGIHTPLYANDLPPLVGFPVSFQITLPLVTPTPVPPAAQDLGQEKREDPGWEREKMTGAWFKTPNKGLYSSFPPTEPKVSSLNIIASGEGFLTLTAHGDLHINTTPRLNFPHPRRILRWTELAQDGPLNGR
jgi:hypothetical protein